MYHHFNSLKKNQFMMNQKKKSNFEQFHSFRSPPNCNPLKTNLVYLYFDPELNIAKKP